MVDSNPGLTAKMEALQNRTALFHNFTGSEFIGFWNGRGRKFPAGAKVFMPLWQAEHYAKHLTNKILLEKGDANSLASTSPKKPEQVPLFFDLFSKACILQDEGEEILPPEDSNINRINRPAEKAEPTAVDGKPDQIIGGDVPDEDDEEFEDSK